jgi:hypothetical protein
VREYGVLTGIYPEGAERAAPRAERASEKSWHAEDPRKSVRRIQQRFGRMPPVRARLCPAGLIRSSHRPQHKLAVADQVVDKAWSTVTENVREGNADIERASPASAHQPLPCCEGSEATRQRGCKLVRARRRHCPAGTSLNLRCACRAGDDDAGLQIGARVLTQVVRKSTPSVSGCSPVCACFEGTLPSHSAVLLEVRQR